MFSDFGKPSVNAVVFDGAPPSAASVVSRIETEGRAWKLAGMFKDDYSNFLAMLSRWTRASS